MFNYSFNSFYVHFQNCKMLIWTCKSILELFSAGKNSSLSVTKLLDGTQWTKTVNYDQLLRTHMLRSCSNAHDLIVDLMCIDFK